MNIPEVTRVVYKKNPLDSVICQLRYPPILKIDTELPSQFQEAIRNDFPLYQEEPVIKVEAPPLANIPIPESMLADFRKSVGIKNHAFISDDSVWKINLTRHFIALSCKQYERWELFIEKVNKIAETLIDIYSPPFFNRTGLRSIRFT